jgi:hypothetical protein
VAPKFGLPNVTDFFGQALNQAKQVIQAAPKAVQGGAQKAVQTYKSLPPFVRSAVNPFSSANPIGVGGITRAVGLGLITDHATENVIGKNLPPELRPEFNEFLAYTGLPLPQWAKLGGYALMSSKPVGRAEDQIMAQIRKEYYDKVSQQRTARNNTTTQGVAPGRGGLEAAGPAEPAYRPPGAPPAAPSTSPAAAAATQQPPPAATTPVTPAPMNELAQMYAQQKQLGQTLGAEEMVRRIRQADPNYGISDENLAVWAKQNPALAYREMMKREGLTR